MSVILTIDLGKRQSVTCIYDLQTHQWTFGCVATTPAAIHDLIVETAPARLVIEVGSQAGWIHDLAVALEVPIQVANTADEKWKWSNGRRKTDRDDALKLARLSAMDMLPTVHMPELKMREWRSLIEYRQSLVGRVTAVKNNIRAILDRHGLSWPAGKKGWTLEAFGRLSRQSVPMDQVPPEGLWRGMLHMELRQLDDLQEAVATVESKLNELAEADKRVELVKSIPGVGARLAETVVAIIDKPERFNNTKQIGCYAGLTPRQYQSGDSNRQGRISGAGNKLLRSLLVEVSWLARRHNPWVAEVFARVCRGEQGEAEDCDRGLCPPIADTSMGDAA